MHLLFLCAVPRPFSRILSEGGTTSWYSFSNFHMYFFLAWGKKAGFDVSGEISWHLVFTACCRWYVMLILLRVFLSPPTRELQLLRSFQRRKFPRRKLGRSLFGSGNGLLLWCLDIAGGRRVPNLVLVSCRLLVVVQNHGMWDIVVLLQRFIRKVDFAQVWTGTRVYLVTERREMAPWVASRRLPWTSGKASVHHSLDVCNLHMFSDFKLFFIVCFACFKTQRWGTSIQISFFHLLDHLP